MGNYRELEVWQKARTLASHVYRLSTAFPRAEMFGLTQQIRRAAVSIASNIAEGHGRRTAGDRLHFFLIARGSLYEVETQAVIAADLGFISATAAADVVGRVNETIRLLNGLIRHYDARPR